MKRRMTVLVDLPPLQLQDQNACARYRVNVATLKSSWRAWVWWYCHRYHSLHVTVRVRGHSRGEEPRWSGVWGAPDVPWTALAAAWLGAVGHLAMLHGAARGRNRTPRQRPLQGVDTGDE